ncbi:urease accessory protein UreF [Litoribrevibacter albus]|uniref:Urease accessory protein UreF n=1 Tax=Litoribrevibacter albus TaxID=1473156 RepID=A0AA37SBZ7_9GAMM|nr:urease accessory UreF family protein [Litoribrevibacter albus]GLQ32619.1 urease accessory protein UreF [Litoribrevibacter albus]
MKTTSLLSLLHISSPALPIGAFAYSQGLEYTLDAGWCKTAKDVEQWIESVLRFGLAGVDLPILQRLHQAWQTNDQEAVQHWNDMLLAFRETKELYLEDVQVGAAFKQWHLAQLSESESLKQADDIEAKLEWLEKPSVVAMYALHGVLTDIPVEECLIGFCWAWLENQIAAASKAMPMGQTDGQRIMRRLIPVIDEVVAHAMTLPDEEVGSGLVGLAMSSSLHEHQYSRLFRS